MVRRWLRRGAVILLLSQWTQLLVQTLSIVVLAHFLLPRAFGIVAMVSAVIGLASVLGEFGLSLSALTAKSLEDRQRTNLFWANTVVGALIMIVVIGIAPVLASFYHRPALVAVTVALATPFLLNSMAVQFKVELNLKYQWLKLAASESIPAVVGFSAAVIVAVITHSYWALVVQQVLGSIVQVSLAVLLSGWRPGPLSRPWGIRDHLRFGRDTAAVQTLNYLASNADSVLIGHTLGASALGQYNRAYSLAVQPMYQFATPLTRIVLPKLTELQGRAREAQLVRYQSVLTYGQLLPLSLLFATAHSIVPLLLGPHWDAVPRLAQIEAIGSGFSALSYVLYWAFLSARRTGLMVFSEGTCEMGMIVGMVLIVHTGSAAVAWVVTAGQLAILLSSSIMAKRALGLRLMPLVRASAIPVTVLGSAALVGAGLGAVIRPTSPLIGLALTGGAWLAICAGYVLAIPRVRVDVRSLMQLLRVRS